MTRRSRGRETEGGEGREKRETVTWDLKASSSRHHTKFVFIFFKYKTGKFSCP